MGSTGIIWLRIDTSGRHCEHDNKCKDQQYVGLYMYYVCMHVVCMYVQTYVCGCILISVYTSIYVCPCIYIWMH
jgi:hypothetical protein